MHTPEHKARPRDSPVALPLTCDRTVRKDGPSRRVQVVVRPVPGHSGLASRAGRARAHRST